MLLDGLEARIESKNIEVVIPGLFDPILRAKDLQTVTSQETTNNEFIGSLKERHYRTKRRRLEKR